MTDEPRHDHQAAQGYPPEADTTSGHAAEAWGAHQEPGEEPGHVAPPEPVAGARIWPRIAGVLLLFVIAGGVWVWQNPGFVDSSLRWILPGSSNADSATAALDRLDARVTRLEQAVPPDLAGLSQRLDAVEARQRQTAAPDLRPLLTRLDAVEARVSALGTRPGGPITAPDQTAGGSDVRSLAARLDALERQQAGEAADAARLEGLQAQISALSARNPADLNGQLVAIQRRVDELAANQTRFAGTSDRVTRLAQLSAAEMALATGRPLGAIANAPPALTRFATAAPPTQAGLRLAFAAAAQQAMQVSLPDTEGKPFFDRVLARLQDFRLITVREGDHVVIGNSTAAILAHARVLLDVGDLGGAIKAVGSLSGPPAAKMAPWLADATALQAAREALASLGEPG